MDAIPDAISQAASPSFLPVRTGCVLSQLGPVTVEDVIAVIRKLSDKQCSTDIQLTSLLKKCADELAPFLTHLFNRSMIVYGLQFSGAKDLIARRAVPFAIAELLILQVVSAL